MLFVRAVDNTPANRQALAQVFVDGGSGQTLADELEMFDNVAGFSLSGQPPAQAFGINTAAKATMRDGFINLLQQLTNARYAVIANTNMTERQLADTELFATNFPITINGQLVTWTTALNYLENEFGLLPIIPETQP